MSSELLAALTPRRRLALSYATQSSRPLFLGLMALDARLQGIVLQSREPLLGQIKLAWWREQLNLPAERRAKGEPLLECLHIWGEGGAALAALADGWETQLSSASRSDESIAFFAEARARVSGALAAKLGFAPAEAERAGFCWALADLAELQGVSPDLIRISNGANWRKPDLARSLRPLTIFHGLANRVQKRGFSTVGLGDLFAAMRLGLTGY